MNKIESENRLERQKERADNFFIIQKIPCVGFWMEIGQKNFKFRPFLLIDLKLPNFTNFGRLFLKESPL